MTDATLYDRDCGTIGGVQAHWGRERKAMCESPPCTRKGKEVLTRPARPPAATPPRVALAEGAASPLNPCQSDWPRAGDRH